MAATISFLDSEFPPAAPGQARFHVIPAPMEMSVSFGRGAAAGPAAILAASRELEAADGDCRPGAQGIYTAPPIDGSPPAEACLRRIESAVATSLKAAALPVLLGGEHTVTLAAARALKAQGREVGFLQFDAHADLRDRYRDDPLSHAGVMRRVRELGFPVFQLAVRCLAEEEKAFRRSAGVLHLDAADCADPDVPCMPRLPDGFPRHLYVTFDLDAFDPSVLPETGTPVPGGLSWRRAMRLLDALCAGRRLLGVDVVELAPAKDSLLSAFTAATLTYRLMRLAIESEGNSL